jgi:hypothetical protein
MQRMNLKGLISVIYFDQPLRTNYVAAEFSIQHQKYQRQYSNWPFGATRRKMVTRYWFQEAFPNFVMIFITGISLTLPFYSTWREFLPSTFLVGFISFLTLTGFIYFPAFYSDFLPKLDAIIADQEKLASHSEDTKRCKRTQFSIPTLTVIFYVFCKTGNIPLPAANDQSAVLLNKIFGTTNGSLKDNLSRLYNISRLSVKERAEIRKGIEAARTFFEELDSPPALQVLDQLELKIQKT